MEKPRARYFADFEYRTAVNTIVASAVTALIGFYELAVACIYGGQGAVWAGTLSGYYLTLAFVRLAILLSHRVGLRLGETEEVRVRRHAANYLAAGALLVLVALTFSGIAVLTVLKGYHPVYAGHLIFAAAFYAFWKTGAAIAGVVKAGKGASLTVQAYRSINIADALVSVVSLQSAMLAAYTTAEDALDPNLFNAVTGGIAGALVLALGVFMIVRGARRLRGSPAEEGESEA